MSRKLKVKDKVKFGPHTGVVNRILGSRAVIVLDDKKGSVLCTLKGKVLPPLWPSVEGSVEKLKKPKEEKESTKEQTALGVAPSL